MQFSVYCLIICVYACVCVYMWIVLFVFTSSSSQVLAARKKQAMAMQRRYFGRAWRQT